MIVFSLRQRTEFTGYAAVPVRMSNPIFYKPKSGCPSFDRLMKGVEHMSALFSNRLRLFILSVSFNQNGVDRTYLLARNQTSVMWLKKWNHNSSSTLCSPEEAGKNQLVIKHRTKQGKKSCVLSFQWSNSKFVTFK